MGTSSWLPRVIEERLTRSDAAYDGPVLVEQSTPVLLIISHDVIGADGTQELPGRFIYQNYSRAPFPLLPVGAQLWLTREPAESSSQPDGTLGPVENWAFTLRAGQAGAILLGAAIGKPSKHSTKAWPVKLTRLLDNAEACSLTLNCTHRIEYPVEVAADSATQVSVLSPVELRISGEDYLVSGGYAPETSAAICPDFISTSRIKLDVRALQPASLLTNASIKALPECSQGTDEVPSVAFALSWFMPPPLPQSGPIYFMQKTSQDSIGGATDTYRFEDRDAFHGEVTVTVTSGLLPDFETYQELWLDVPASGLYALRESQGGALQLLSFSARLPLSPELEAAVSAQLGVPFKAQEQCRYAVRNADELTLSQVHLDAMEPISLRNGSLSTALLNESEYVVSVSGLEYLSFAVWR